MKSSAVCVAIVVLTAGAKAQNNPVERRVPTTLWLEAANHPVTLNPFSDTRQMPAGHVGAGVPAGTLNYVWIPSEINARDEDEVIDGFRAPLGPSPATGQYPSTGYFPELKIHRSKSLGTGVVPDTSLPPYFVLPEAPLVFPRFEFFESTSALLVPYTLVKSQREVVISLQWRGGDSRLQADTLNMWGDATAANTQDPRALFGFVSPTGQVTAVTMPALDPGYFNLTYTRASPSIQLHSDWVPPSFAPTTAGYSVASYRAPLALASGTIGLDLIGGPAFANHQAIPLMNIGSVVGGSFSLLGATIELNPLDPAIAALANAGVIVTLDNMGVGTGPLLPVPALGSGALGLNLGFEYVLLDNAGSAVSGSTQAVWMSIDR